MNTHPLSINIANLLNEESYKDLFDKAHDLIHFISPGGTIIYVNHSWSSTLGYSINEVQGASVYDFVAEEDRDNFKTYRQNIIKGDIINEETIVRFRSKTGGTVSLQGFISLKSEAGVPLYTRGIFRDITAKLENEARLKEREWDMAQLLKNAPDAVVVINQEGKVIFWNLKAQIMFGWHAEDVIGHTLSETIIPPRYRNAHEEGMKRFLATGEAHVLNKTIELTALNKVGSEFHISLTISQTDQQIRKAFIAFIRDISAQKANEAELENKRKQLEASNQQLEQFAFVASHDLQEPLRKIRTFSDILSRQMEPAADLRKYVDKINASAERMSGLIANLLEYSRLLNANIRFDKVDLNLVLQNVLLDYELLITQTNARIQLDNLPTIKAVPFQMNQLFYNLIGNALKFTKPNIEPVVSITKAKVDDKQKIEWGLEAQKEYIKILVKDNGIGFEQNYANKIFTVFQRLNERSQYGGYGIGLALCKKVVEGHKGLIFAEGTLKEGAAFTVVLPEKQ